MRKAWMLGWALALVGNSALAAPNWKLVGGDSETDVYVDVNGVRATEAWRKAWVLWDLSVPRDDGTGLEYLSRKALHYVKCDEGTMATAQISFYSGRNGDGKVVSTASRGLAEIEFVDPVPESIGESVRDAVCAASVRKS